MNHGRDPCAANAGDACGDHGAAFPAAGGGLARSGPHASAQPGPVRPSGLPGDHRPGSGRGAAGVAGAGAAAGALVYRPPRPDGGRPDGPGRPGQGPEGRRGLAALGEGERLPMVRDLEDLFPALRGTDYRIDSPQDPDYNCRARDLSGEVLQQALHPPAHLQRVRAMPRLKKLGKSAAQELDSVALAGVVAARSWQAWPWAQGSPGPVESGTPSAGRLST